MTHLLIYTRRGQETEMQCSSFQAACQAIAEALIVGDLEEASVYNLVGELVGDKAEAENIGQLVAYYFTGRKDKIA